jgi:uncharacterized repeat protein (TIGR03803 family)
MGQEYPLSVRARNYSNHRTGFAYSAMYSARAFQRIALGSAFLFLLGWTQPKANAQVTILHSFGDGTVPHDGTDPQAGLIQAPNGNFYGVTYGNVANPGAEGTVFQMTTAATVSVVKVLSRGNFMTKPLVYDNGKLVGISYGAVAGNGALFALTESAKGTWSKSNWYKFVRSSGGPSGSSGVILGPDGDLYGLTVYGGTGDDGTAYKVNPKTQALKVIGNFPGPSFTDSPTTDLLLATDGNFYGGAYDSDNSTGSIFQLTPSGAISTFYTFSGSAVSLDADLIEGTDGNFYGIAGSYIFKLTPDGTFTILHTLVSATDGYSPAGALAQGPNGNLYGLNTFGGTASDGTLYEVSTDGSTFTVLHNFGDGSIQNDGLYPAGRLLLGADNNFYGVTQQGGSADKGTIFKVSP